MTDQKEPKESTQASNDTVDKGRREALAKLGRYGAYTAPALLGLLIGTKAAEAGSP